MDKPITDQANHKRFCESCGSQIERYYSIESAAELFDCSQQFFRNLVRDRKIGFVKVGRLVRIPDSELLKIIEFTPASSDELQILVINQP